MVVRGTSTVTRSQDVLGRLPASSPLTGATVTVRIRANEKHLRRFRCKVLWSQCDRVQPLPSPAWKRSMHQHTTTTHRRRTQRSKRVHTTWHWLSTAKLPPPVSGCKERGTKESLLCVHVPHLPSLTSHGHTRTPPTRLCKASQQVHAARHARPHTHLLCFLFCLAKQGTRISCLHRWSAPRNNRKSGRS